MLLNLHNVELKEVLNSISTDSKLEEMISLMITDPKILEISIGNKQLYKEGNQQIEALNNWQLSEQEASEFFGTFKEEIMNRTGIDIRNECLLEIIFSDTVTSVLLPPVAPKYGIFIRKKEVAEENKTVNNQIPQYKKSLTNRYPALSVAENAASFEAR